MGCYVKKPVCECSWDKGDLNAYYSYTGDLLSKINDQFCCNDVTRCQSESRQLNIDTYYTEIVHCLLETFRATIPKIPVSALKHYWTPALDDLKHELTETHNLWKAADTCIW